MELENSYARLPDRFFERIRPERFENPELVLFNFELSNELGLSFSSDEEMAQVFSGQSLLPGSEPIAQAYAGFQFGHLVSQLGDGRAHLLGEIKGFDLQLKGSGQTRFSRKGDGRSALGPVIREFLVSEGMHALGVPTTRALAVVKTGETVIRQDGPEPGGIFTRVASSHLRIGTFQYFAFREDLDALEKLVDYTIRRHYPEIESQDLSQRCLELLTHFSDRQGNLVAQWYGLGFIHGVMNTDNCSMAGITIDYGPCAFMDEFQSNKVFSSIDEHGRYAYANQMPILEWNIHRLADCLLPLIDSDLDKAKTMVVEALHPVLSSFSHRVHRTFASKLGFVHDLERVEHLVKDFLRLLQAHSLDFTLSFSNLEGLYFGNTEFFPNDPMVKRFLRDWKALEPCVSQLSTVNAKLVPRNHQIQRVIHHGNRGDFAPLKEMWEALKTPFEVREEHRYLIAPPQPHERVYQTFCGT